MPATIKLRRMVDQIEKKLQLDPQVRDAFMAIDREVFVPTAFRHLAYNLDALPMLASQWISTHCSQNDTIFRTPKCR